MDLARRLLPRPSDEQIVSAARALHHRGLRASVKALCAVLWPELPWLPQWPGQDAARGALFCWPCDPPLPDGRRSTTQPAAEWLHGRCQALLRRGWLVPAPMGCPDTVDLIAHAAYQPPPSDLDLNTDPGLPCAMEAPCARAL